MTQGREVPRASYRDVLGEPRFRVLFGTRTLVIAADSLRAALRPA